MAFSWRDIFRRRQPQVSEARPPVRQKIVVGANSDGDTSLSAFDNSNITYSSQLSSLDYDALLRDKQKNINDLYRLADYYCDSDPIVRGIIKGVYVPFSVSGYYLTGENEKTIALFEEQYEKMRLREHIDEIFLQYYKYNNVFVYIWNGNIVTLPPHKCKIGNTMINGTPIVDFDVLDIQNEFRQRSYSVLEQKGVKDDVLDEILKGYPPQVAKALKKGQQYAQLDPNNVFVLQGSKEGWTRYAVPWISSALPALAKKELIGNYETQLLNLGARSFIHITYGDTTKDRDILPDITQLQEVRSIFANAMKGNPLAVTNHLAAAKVIQADLSDLYQWPLYDQVNADILAAGGIAGIIVNGNSEDGSTFASAQVSMQAAAARIEAARAEFEDFMTKVNIRLVEDIKLVHTNNLKSIPVFHFLPLDMNGKKALREQCTQLWNQGVVSTKTLLETQGYSLAKEKAQRETEASDGTDDILLMRGLNTASSHDDSDSGESGEGKVGRPKMTDEQRNSDPENAIRSKQSKDAADGDASLNTE